MPSNPQTLFDQSKCFACYGASEAELLKLALLDQISQGGSGACANLEGPQADPTGIYTPTFVGQVYVTSGHVWQATGLTSADWTEICTDENPMVHSIPTVSMAFFALDSDGISPAGFTTLIFPNLTTMDDSGIGDSYFEVTGFSDITTVSLPVLANVVGDLTIAGNSSMTALSLPALTNISNNLTIGGSPLLVSASFPVLVTIGGNVNGTFCQNLTTVNVPVWVPTDGTTIDFQSCALNQASVDLILHRCVVAAVTTCTIDLSGGTSSAPSAAGLIDKGILIGAGNTVLTN